jgi:hypothetical protein
MTQPVADSVKDAREVGRTRIVAGFFRLCGILTGITTASAVIDLCVRLLGGRGVEGKDLLFIGQFGLLTLGFLRTSRLLRRYQRSGGYLALLCLAGSLVEGFRAPTRNWIGLGILLFGLALLLLGWKELE